MLVPGPLRSYTGAAQVGGAGSTLAEVLADLDRRFPGMRFRMIDEHESIRPHIKLFVDRAQARSLEACVRDDAEVMIVCALSGG